MADQSSQDTWTDNPLISQEVMKRITGGVNKFWLNWLLEDYLAQPLDHVLSVGCGTGDHEIIAVKTGLVKKIDAFDASPRSIAVAKVKSSTLEEGKINFVVSTFEQYVTESQSTKHYDGVFCFGALHHVYDLESMVHKLYVVMNPEGYLLFNEYVGPCYTIYPEKQVELVNGLLSCIDPSFRVIPDVLYTNPSFEQVLNHDPTEAVRSALILPTLKMWFDVTMVRPFGGSILHALYSKLNHTRMSDNSPETVSIIRLLLEIEKILVFHMGNMTSDFCVGVCRPKIR